MKTREELYELFRQYHDAPIVLYIKSDAPSSDRVYTAHSKHYTLEDTVKLTAIIVLKSLTENL